MSTHTTEEYGIALLIQQNLQERGIYKGSLDGDWGEKSEAAFNQYMSRVQTPAPAPAGTEPKWLGIARQELGQAEVGGARDNARIVEYHQATSLGAPDDETPWCSAFVNWCLKQAGIAGTNNAMARSFLKWGETLPTPRLGAVVVFKRGAPPQGHVAFYLNHVDGKVRVLGGNQGNKVSVAAFSAADVLGYRWPKA